MSELIVIRDLTKHFGPLKAVNGVSFTVRRGEVLGFLGPNGAGKSTTMKMITGFLAPTSGSIRVAGFDVLADPVRAKREIGYLPEGAPAYGDMTPLSFLSFIADIRGLSGDLRKQRLTYAVERANLTKVLHQPIDTLSKGFKRRVGLAQALLHDPQVLVLDEPTDGLDPNQKHEVRALIQELSGDKAIIVSTHILEEVEAICTRALIIAQGQVVADGTPAELAMRDPAHNAIAITLPEAQRAAANARLQALPGVLAVEALPDGLLVRPVPGAAPAGLAMAGAPLLTEIGTLARTENWAVGEIRVERGRLDTVFRSITRTVPEAA